MTNPFAKKFLMDKITEQLQSDGVDAFAESYDSLLNSLKEKRQAFIQGIKETQILALGQFKPKVDDRLKSWKKQNTPHSNNYYP